MEVAVIASISTPVRPLREALAMARTASASKAKATLTASSASGWHNGISSPVYTVNQDADSWHYLVLWRRYGNLYTLSEHVAPPLTGQKVRRYLKHELASLVLFRPSPS